jgi:hypothetical protein
MTVVTPDSLVSFSHASTGTYALPQRIFRNPRLGFNEEAKDSASDFDDEDNSLAAALPPPPPLGSKEDIVWVLYARLLPLALAEGH